MTALLQVSGKVRAKRIRSHDRHDQIAVAVNTLRVNQELRDYVCERDMPAYFEKSMAEAFPGELNT